MPDPRRAEVFDRFSRAVDGPLTILALAFVGLLIVPLAVDLSAGAEQALLAVDYLIWAVFAVEYFGKLWLAPDRGRFVRTHIPDLILVVIPVLRPLRILRSARILRLFGLARAASAAGRGLRDVGLILRSRGLSYVLLVVLAVVALGAVLVREFESGVKDSNIASFPDALWWATTTVTTVGYGDRVPVSAAGRGVAVVLMISGIAVFGVLTATIAAFFVEREQKQDVGLRLDSIDARLAAIEEHLPRAPDRS